MGGKHGKSDAKNQSTNHERKNKREVPCKMPLTRKQGEESVELVLERGMHYNATDKSVSIMRTNIT
jgi:hypothetical protein